MYVSNQPHKPITATYHKYSTCLAHLYVTGIPPGSSVSPKNSQLASLYPNNHKSKQEELTALDILLNSLLLSAFRSLGTSLHLKTIALVQIAALIHGALQSIALPAEEIIAMLAVTGSVFTHQYANYVIHVEDLPVTHGVHEWLSAVGGPHALVAELTCVPENLCENVSLHYKLSECLGVSTYRT